MVLKWCPSAYVAFHVLIGRASYTIYIIASIRLAVMDAQVLTLLCFSYDQSKSPDSRTLNGQSALSLGAGNFSGTIVKENCSLATTVDGTSWPYTNQTSVYFPIGLMV